MQEQANYFNQFVQGFKKSVKDKLFKPDPTPPPSQVSTQLPKQKMQPALLKAVENGQPNKATFIALSESSIIRGGLVGAILTSLIGFNAGKYSRLGAIRKRIRFVRKFVSANKKPYLTTFTNYFYPNLKTVTKNFLCFSGQQGIGKSYHFQNMAYLQSLVRPALYVSFKACGVNSTFQQDLATKLDYGGGENPLMLSQIIQAVRKIHKINTKPYQFWAKVVGVHIGFAWAAVQIIQSQLLQANEGLFLGMLGTAYAYYFYMYYPYIIQSLRRTKCLVIFDDVNKIDNIGQLAQISRYLQLHQQDMGNVILVSSDEQTWFKLRKQPGLKDRLRQRIIAYNHTYTANQLLNYIADDTNYKNYIQTNRVSPLYTKQLVILLIKELIGNRQGTIRRIKSLLILNDEVQYEQYVQVLVSCRQGKITGQEAVQKILAILYESQMETLCAKLKHIRKDINMSEQVFIKQMKTLLQKGKLLSDNKLGPFLMAYNIVRDNQSEYVFNGKFMYTVFQMAYEQYIKDLENYHKQSTGVYDIQSQFNSNIASRDQQNLKKQKLSGTDTQEILQKAQIYDKKQ